MKTVLRNGCALSGLCLGTASMGSEGLSGAPLQKAFAILDTYYAMGGRFLDTANVYGRWGVGKMYRYVACRSWDCGYDDHLEVLSLSPGDT